MTRGALPGRCLLAAILAVGPAAAWADAPPAAAPARVEARSADLYVVGVVQGDRMAIHVSRALDNSPVQNATVTVALRGGVFAAVADVDGGYSFRAAELAQPGAAALEFRVATQSGIQRLAGTLQVDAAADRPAGDASGTARQIAWWILNFAVCGGFVVLIARRRKRAEPADGDDA